MIFQTRSNFVKNIENLDDFFKNLKIALLLVLIIFIFSKRMYSKNTIINYHNALLPFHRGCNAHIWSIWENDKNRYYLAYG